MASSRHQHLSDCTLVGETIGLMLEANSIDGGAKMLQQVAEILKCLAAIDANVASRSNINLSSKPTDAGVSRSSVRVKVSLLGAAVIS